MNKLGIKASTRAFVSGMSSAFEIAPKTRVLVVKKAKYSGYEQDSNSFASDMKAIGSDFNTAIKSRGQVFALVVTILFFILSLTLILKDQFGLGAAMMGVTLIAIVAIFITGRGQASTEGEQDDE